MKRSGQWYMVTNEIGMRERGGKELTLRLAHVAPYWYYQMVPVMSGVRGTLLDGDRRTKLAVLATDEKGAREALDCYMRDVALPRNLRVITNETRRPSNSCIYCSDGIPMGMPYCRRSACMVKAQMNLRSRGRL